MRAGMCVPTNVYSAYIREPDGKLEPRYLLSDSEYKR